MPRVTTCIVSNYQRDRTHRADFQRGESRDFTVDFRALIPDDVTLAYAEWWCLRPDVTYLTAARCGATSCTVNVGCLNNGGGVLKVQVTLTNGSKFVQMCNVFVSVAPWFYPNDPASLPNSPTYLRADYSQGPGQTFIISGNAPNGSVGFYFQYDYTYQGGRAPISWGLSGSVPPGLSIDQNGRLSGTPSTSGSYAFTVQAQSADGQFSSVPNTVIINSATLSLTGKLANGTVGSPYSSGLATIGGTAPFTWSIDSGTLPPGLTINPSTGVISGAPTA